MGLQPVNKAMELKTKRKSVATYSPLTEKLMKELEPIVGPKNVTIDPDELKKAEGVSR